jgi:hypothetical protein
VYQEKSFHIKGSLSVNMMIGLKLLAKLANSKKEVMPMIKKRIVSLLVVGVILQMILSISMHISGEGRLTVKGLI